MGLRSALETEMANAGNPRQSAIPRGKGWISRILYILFSLEAGTFLIVFPWLNIWEENYFVYLYPTLHPILDNAFLKGAILGLGVVNLFLGVKEIVEVRKSAKGIFSG